MYIYWLSICWSFSRSIRQGQPSSVPTQTPAALSSIMNTRITARQNMHASCIEAGGAGLRANPQAALATTDMQ